jgi:hypothetical protein
MNTVGVPMEMALQLLSRYIYDHKGIAIQVNPPKTAREVEIFEQIIGPVLERYGIQL